MTEKLSQDFIRFKDLLRRLVAVPKKDADESAEKYKEQGNEEPEPEA
jgi:hypothetical protein